MENNKLLRFSSLALIFGFALATSCKKDEEEKISSQDTVVITEEAATESYFQEIDDMAGVAIAAPSDNQYNGGRVSTTTITINDDRFKCDGVVVTHTLDPNSTTETPKGAVTIDFGTTGCTDLKGNVRTGKLIFTYSGKRFQSGASIVTTTENYTINGIKLEGTRTITNTTSATDQSPNFKFTSILTGGKATFPDQTVASRSSNIKCTWLYATNELVIDQTSVATGQTRAGRSYEVTLLEDLTFKRFCGIAVSGTKHYLIDGSKEFTIDYGDGSCDKKVVISANDVTREITVN